MKIRINQTNLAQFPSPISAQIQAWRCQHGRIFFHLSERQQITTAEDARYSVVNTQTGASAQGQAGGTFAGLGNFMPNLTMAIPPAVFILEEGYFCGQPYLNIYYNSGIQQLPKATA